MNCKERQDMLTAYALGALDEAQRDEFRKHLEICGECQAALREIEPTLDILRDALASPPSSAPQRLSAARRAQVMATKPAPARARRSRATLRSAIRWTFEEHPALRRAAAIVLIGAVVLIFLVTPVVVNFSGKQEKSLIKATRASHAALDTAVDVYETDTGHLPKSLDDLVKNDGSDNWHGPYVRGGIPKDAKGKEFKYQQTGNGYEITSGSGAEAITSGGGRASAGLDSYFDQLPAARNTTVSVVPAAAPATAPAGQSTVTETISGNGTLNKVGDGGLTLSGANVYSGATVVNGGTVQAAAAPSDSLQVADKPVGGEKVQNREMEELKIELPKPMFVGTPKEVKGRFEPAPTTPPPPPSPVVVAQEAEPAAVSVSGLADVGSVRKDLAGARADTDGDEMADRSYSLGLQAGERIASEAKPEPAPGAAGNVRFRAQLESSGRGEGRDQVSAINWSDIRAAGEKGPDLKKPLALAESAPLKEAEQLRRKAKASESGGWADGTVTRAGVGGGSGLVKREGGATATLAYDKSKRDEVTWALGRGTAVDAEHEKAKAAEDRKAPVLGDVPVVGQLFREDGRKVADRELAEVPPAGAPAAVQPPASGSAEMRRRYKSGGPVEESAPRPEPQQPGEKLAIVKSPVVTKSAPATPTPESSVAYGFTVNEQKKQVATKRLAEAEAPALPASPAPAFAGGTTISGGTLVTKDRDYETPGDLLKKNEGASPEKTEYLSCFSFDPSRDKALKLSSGTVVKAGQMDANGPATAGDKSEVDAVGQQAAEQEHAMVTDELRQKVKEQTESDSLKVSLRGAGEGEYAAALRERRDSLLADLARIEKQYPAVKNSPDVTDNRETVARETGAPAPAKECSKEGDVAARFEQVRLEDRYKALRLQLAAVEAAEYKWQSKNSSTNLVNTEQERDSPPSEDLTGPRFKAVGVNPLIETKVQPFSTFSIDVDTASYTLARNYMVKGFLPPAESVRTEEFVNFFDYAYKPPVNKTFAIDVQGAPSKFGRGMHMLKIGVKGQRLGREEQRGAVLTALVDTSGSMNTPDRIGLVKKSLNLLAERLGPKDRLAIVQYDNHARVVLAPTQASNRKAIVAAVDSIQCNGPTNLEEGMHKAYTVASDNFVPGSENRVLIMSDGAANMGAMGAEEILKKVETSRKQGIFCSVFGFGQGTYNDEILEGLANKGDGVYRFIDSEAEARQVFVEDLAATLNTIAKDVKIQVEFSKDAVAQYRQLGYENRQLKTEDFRNDAVDAGEVGSGQSVTALYEVQLAPQFLSARSGPDDICTVRVRYRRTDNNRVEEIEQRFRLREMASDFAAADVRFRLAACVAEFSEILRGSPFAAGSEFNDVAAMLRPVALELNLDTRVAELLRLVEGAKGMSRGQ